VAHQAIDLHATRLGALVAGNDADHLFLGHKLLSACSRQLSARQFAFIPFWLKADR
jgi:hypothetical protein